MSELFSYNRHGIVVTVEEPNEDATEEEKLAWKCLIAVRGVFKSKKEAEDRAFYSRKIKVTTGSPQKSKKVKK